MSDKLLDDLTDIIRDVCRGRFSFDLPLVFEGNQMPDGETKGPRNNFGKLRTTYPQMTRGWYKIQLQMRNTSC